MSLKNEECIPCKGEVPPLNAAQCSEFKKQIHSSWVLTHTSTRLSLSLKYKGFKKPLRLLNEVAQIANTQNHHPDFKLGWGYLELEITTHSINGLTKSDFILAAKIDEIVQE